MMMICFGTPASLLGYMYAMIQRIVKCNRELQVSPGTNEGSSAVETESGEAMPNEAADTPRQHARDMAAASRDLQ